MIVENLRCEYLCNPMGIDVLQPRLNWEILSTRRNMMQKAYRILVACSEADLVNKVNLVWDTGKVISESSVHCEYRGASLESRKRYYWKVCVWNEKDENPVWSEPAWWEMGLLSMAEWKAKWIEPRLPRIKEEAPFITLGVTLDADFKSMPSVPAEEKLNPCTMLRKAFSVEAGIKQARVYATAHGIYKLEINGEVVGDREFAPEYTSYDKYIAYQTYDVTDMIRAGSNVIGAVIADGWYAGIANCFGDNCQYGDMHALMMQMEIEYLDGTVQLVVTDESFKCSTGPWIYSDLSIGEKYDARLEKAGWSTSDFDDTEWLEVDVADYDNANLVAQHGDPVRKLQEISVVKIITTPKGETVLDFGQNIAGRVRFKLAAAAGTEITLEHSEVLNEEGNFINNIVGRNHDQKETYVFKGAGLEEYEPYFTFHGFRYVKITGYVDKFSITDFSAIVLSTDMQKTGSFQCSDNRINRLQENIVWSQKGNMLSIPTDCPQRERAGWTGDIQIYSPTACFNMDMDAFLTRWLRNLALDQQAEGEVPHVVPYLKTYKTCVGNIVGHTSAAWGDACIIVPWELYQKYNDKRVLEENYSTMVKWMNFIEKTASDNIPDSIAGQITDERRERQKYLWNTGFHFGDWLFPSCITKGINCAEVTKEYVASCFFAYSTDLMSKISKVLDRKVEARYYENLNSKIREAFTAEYLMDDGSFKAHYQGVYVLALQFRMVPDSMRNKVLSQLIHLIEESGNKLDTGFVSVPFLLDVLIDNGRKDMAYKLLHQNECPSWLYEVEKGATTIWEAWQAIMPDGKTTKVSYNHYAFGCVGDWMYRVVAGIRINKPGYKHIDIKPEPDEKLTYANASYHSVYGEIYSGWEKINRKMVHKVIIPPNTTASVWLWGANQEDVSESGISLSESKDIFHYRQEENKVLVEVGSGEYVFEYPLHIFK